MHTPHQVLFHPLLLYSINKRVCYIHVAPGCRLAQLVRASDPCTRLSLPTNMLMVSGVVVQDDLLLAEIKMLLLLVVDNSSLLPSYAIVFKLLIICHSPPSPSSLTFPFPQHSHASSSMQICYIFLLSQ